MTAASRRRMTMRRKGILLAVAALAGACVATPPALTVPGVTATTARTVTVTANPATAGCTFTFYAEGLMQTWSQPGLPATAATFTYTGPVPVGASLTATCPTWSEATQSVTVPATATAAFTLTLTRPPVPTLPPMPTRNQILHAPNGGMEGEVFTDPACGGPFVWWDPIVTTLTAACRQSVYAMKRAYGDTKIIIPISWAYLESGLAIPNTGGTDFSQNLQALHDLDQEAIEAGFYIDQRLGGDGEGDGPGYNDPVGHTFGRQWVVDNLPRIYTALADLHGYIEWNPAWDSWFYGWTPQEIADFGAFFRTVCTDAPTCHLMAEMNTGHIPVGDGVMSFSPTGAMSNYDGVQIEFTNSGTGVVHDDSDWQIAGRLLGPAYVRPPDQPSSDDPTPPCYTCALNAQGQPFVVVAFEPDTYNWVRGQETSASALATREYLSAQGFTLIDIPANPGPWPVSRSLPTSKSRPIM